MQGNYEFIPEHIRGEFGEICDDLVILKSKWDFYRDLFSDSKNVELLNQAAMWSFILIESSLRADMTMGICRLGDPIKTHGKTNLSLAFLVDKCSEIDDLANKLTQYKKEITEITDLRNKVVGHKDLITFRNSIKIMPKNYGIHLNRAIEIAFEILNKIYLHYADTEIASTLITASGADTLMVWLSKGLEYHKNSKGF